jgi:hypothetical protein
VPVCYGITLALDMAMGYTINRVTLFALILSLGLLVDDPITGVDNISRFMTRRELALRDRVTEGDARDPRAPGHVDADHRAGLPAPGLHHRHDGALHGADGLQRAGERDQLHRCGFPGHALDGEPPPAGTADG